MGLEKCRYNVYTGDFQNLNPYTWRYIYYGQKPSSEFLKYVYFVYSKVLKIAIFLFWTLFDQICKMHA